MANLAPDHVLQIAIADFKTVLSEEQNKQLIAVKAVPDADSVMIFTASLDQKLSDKARRGRSIATRLYSLLYSTQQFSNIVGTFVSSNPALAALIWGSVQLTMLVRMHCFRVTPLF